MAEPTPVLSPAGPGEPEVYRPLSMMALASVVVAGAYAALMLLFAAVAFFTGKPLFLWLWSLLIPLTALGLAFLARQQIRYAEGVLTGMKLTTWAWWLSVLFGLGYAAYYFGTYLAVSWQAEDFTRKWVEKLQQGKVAQAFLDCQEPAKRKHENPDDPDYMFSRYEINTGRRKGPLSLFKDSELIRLLEQNGPEVTRTPLGVAGWDYDKGGYEVGVAYRVTVPEGVYHIHIPVKSSEGKEITGRQWQVVREKLRFAERPRLSQLGLTLEQWRGPARQFAFEWVKKRNDGDAVGAFLDTLPPGRRAGAALPQFAAAAGGPAALGGLGVILPGFPEYLAGGLIQTRDFESLRKQREEIINAVKAAFRNPSILNIRTQDSKGHARIVDRERGIVQVLFDVELLVFPNGMTASGRPEYYCEGTLVVESEPGPWEAGRRPAWRLAELELARGGKPPKEAGPPGAPGGAPAAVSQ